MIVVHEQSHRLHGVEGHHGAPSSSPPPSGRGPPAAYRPRQAIRRQRFSHLPSTPPPAVHVEHLPPRSSFLADWRCVPPRRPRAARWVLDRRRSVRWRGLIRLISRTPESAHVERARMCGPRALSTSHVFGAAPLIFFFLLHNRKPCFFIHHQQAELLEAGALPAAGWVPTTQFNRAALEPFRGSSCVRCWCGSGSARATLYWVGRKRSAQGAQCLLGQPRGWERAGGPACRLSPALNRVPDRHFGLPKPTSPRDQPSIGLGLLHVALTSLIALDWSGVGFVGEGILQLQLPGARRGRRTRGLVAFGIELTDRAPPLAARFLRPVLARLQAPRPCG